MCLTWLVCTSEDEWKWLFTTMWFILLKQIIKVRHQITYTFTIYDGLGFVASQHYILCAWWVLDVALDQSCCPPGSPMNVSPLPLLQINCLSCSPLGGPGHLRPPPHSDPISLRVPALPHLSICYNKFLLSEIFKFKFRICEICHQVRAEQLITVFHVGLGSSCAHTYCFLK